MMWFVHILVEAGPLPILIELPIYLYPRKAKQETIANTQAPINYSGRLGIKLSVSFQERRMNLRGPKYWRMVLGLC